MRGLVLVFLLSALSAPSASACGILEPDEQRRREREDIELQANLVKEVASEAEDVFVGTVASVDEASRSARIKVQRVVKGAVDQELLLDLVTPKWEVTSQGIKITTKERVIELLKAQGRVVKRAGG